MRAPCARRAPRVGVQNVGEYATVLERANFVTGGATDNIAAIARGAPKLPREIAFYPHPIGRLAA